MKHTISNYSMRDATNDPEASSRANHAPGLRRDLERLGFSPVGVIEAQARSMHRYASTLRGYTNAGESEAMIKFVTQGEAVQITRSADATTFGVVEPGKGGPVISLQTIFENGVVIETATRPSNPLHPVSARRMDPTVRAIAALVAVANAKPPIWPRSNWPKSGFFVERTDNRTARMLFERHRERVQQFRERYRTTIPRHDSLEVYRAIWMRSLLIIHRLNFWNNLLALLTVVLLVLFIFVWEFSQGRAAGSTRLYDTALILFVSLFGLLGAMLLGRMIGPRVGTRLTPLNVLIQRQQEEWGEEGEQ